VAESEILVNEGVTAAQSIVLVEKKGGEGKEYLPNLLSTRSQSPFLSIGTQDAANAIDGP
jgi:hypothetical protein